MIKSELIKTLCNLHPNLLSSDIKKIVNIIFNEITEAVCRNQPVEIRQLGRFFTKSLKAKTGRNPKTGVMLNLPEGRRTIRFKASKVLLKRLNRNFNEKISATY